MNKKLSLFIIGLISAIFVMSASVLAYEAIDTSKLTSLTLNYEYDNIPVSGVNFKVYKVADVSSGVAFTLTGDFKDYPVSFDDIAYDGGRSLASTLSSYVSRDSLTPIRQNTTESNGKVSFTGLPVGLYLLTADNHQSGSYLYKTVPTLICLPNYDDTWNYDVAVSPKKDRDNMPSSNPGGGSSPTPSTIGIKVVKVWDDNNNKTLRPKSIEIELVNEDGVYKTAELNESNRWTYSWTGLNRNKNWSVAEKTVIDGYTVLVEANGNNFVVRNTYSPKVDRETEATTSELIIPPHEDTEDKPDSAEPDNSIPDNSETNNSDSTKDESVMPVLPNDFDNSGSDSSFWDRVHSAANVPEGEDNDGSAYSSVNSPSSGLYNNEHLPQTGQLWWPVPVMALSGMLLFLFGYLRREKDEENA